MVKRKVLALMVASILGLTLLAVSCTPSTTPVIPPDDLEELNTVAGKVTRTHIDLTKKDCLSCHKPPIGDKHIPVPEVWHSFWQDKDFKVVAGSVQDHSGYSVDECFDSSRGCHIMP